MWESSGKREIKINVFPIQGAEIEGEFAKNTTLSHHYYQCTS